MNKVGIITYYSAINEGAFLQAYSLSQFLSNTFQVNVSFIRNPDQQYIDENQKKTLLKTKNPAQYIVNRSRYNSLVSAQKKYLPTSDSTSQFDTVVVGSDEMWNFSNKLFSDFNLARGVLCGRKMSYAVSMGQHNVPPEQDAAEEIHCFDALSVRDQNSFDQISKVTDMPVNINVDPVFLYDIPVVAPQTNLENYLMIYGLITDEKIISPIKKFAKQKDLRIISVDIYNKWCRNVVASSPFEFIGYIDKAKYIFTNMFHGTMLSVVRNKSFVSLLTDRRKMKIQYTANLLGFNKQCVEGCQIATNPNVLATTFENGIDYKEINEKIRIEKERAAQYFRNAGFLLK